VASTTPRKRKGAAAPLQESTTRLTLTLDVGLIARLAAGAAMSRKCVSAYAAELLQEGLRGLVLVDRRKVAEANLSGLVKGIDTDAA
jgi:hypothetical protein